MATSCYYLITMNSASTEVESDQTNLGRTVGNMLVKQYIYQKEAKGLFDVRLFDNKFCEKQFLWRMRV